MLIAFTLYAALMSTSTAEVVPSVPALLARTDRESEATPSYVLSISDNALAGSGDGSSQKAKKPPAKKDEKPAAPPDLGVGKPAIAFTAKTLGGTSVKFPDDFKGKVVLLDFWATWCGPCMAEVPNIVAAYGKYHGQGFEILGVTLDKLDGASKVKKVEKDKGMKWPQILDAANPKVQITAKYAVATIPRAFLVDGDTGLILAMGDDTRGEALARSIESALAAKKPTDGKKKSDKAKD